MLNIFLSFFFKGKKKKKTPAVAANTEIVDVLPKLAGKAPLQRAKVTICH